MPTGADVADWWNENVRKLLEMPFDMMIEKCPNWVPSCVPIYYATLGYAVTEFQAGVVDVLRFGQGFGRGGLGGYGQDALRFAALLGPIGRAAGALRALRLARYAAQVADVGGRKCAWVSATKALRHVGHSLNINGKVRSFAKVEDLVRALGMGLEDAREIRLSELVPKLRSLGQRVRDVVKTNTMDKVALLTPHNGGVVLVNLRVMKNGKCVDGHMIYAFRDFRGRFRLGDRTGGVYHNLDDLLRQYNKARALVDKFDRFEPGCAALVEDVFAKYIDAAEKTAVLAIGVLAGTTIARDTLCQAERAFDRARAGVPSDAQFHYVKFGDTLPSIAQRYYGDPNKWPVIYAGNYIFIGDDPAELPPTLLKRPIWIPKLY